MKKEDVLQKLISLLKGMFVHEKFKEELLALITGKQGCEESIFDDLMIQFKMLDALGINIHRYNGNEILSKSGGIYSLHIKKKSKYNIRLLVKFRNVKGKTVPCLLCAFEEKGKGRKDKHGYSANIDFANARYDAMNAEQ